MDQFRFAVMSRGRDKNWFGDAIDARLAPFACGVAVRTLMSVPLGQPQEQSTPVWSYNAASAQLLRDLFGDGLFTYPAGTWEDGWLEDPTFYREGKLMLGIVSHEREGLLDLTDDEWKELHAEGIRSYDDGVWI